MNTNNACNSNQCSCPDFEPIQPNPLVCSKCGHSSSDHGITPPTITQAPTQPGTTLCARQGCNKPVYSDNGNALDFCGRTHGQEVVANPSLRKPPTPQHKSSGGGLCARQGCNRPVYVDNGNALDFCGRNHGQEVAANPSLRKPTTSTPPTPIPALAPASSTVPTSMTTALPTPTVGSLCAKQGCNRPVYVDNGKALDFCGRTHGQEVTANPSLRKP
eukprot:TRINITY_DN7950_c0_g1_i1.p1 TRINITY_DN7950_c0_g1~~TRINITY_DN7950_c0_g1_i1.p1  ORF type:complete len:217 (-),score=2.22 TRINITY_DN7950_c0_g1_i1:8-658(-)